MVGVTIKHTSIGNKCKYCIQIGQLKNNPQHPMGKFQRSETMSTKAPSLDTTYHLEVAEPALPPPVDVAADERCVRCMS
jgi:hypothetical protein